MQQFSGASSPNSPGARRGPSPPTSPRTVNINPAGNGLALCTTNPPVSAELLSAEAFPEHIMSTQLLQIGATTSPSGRESPTQRRSIWTAKEVDLLVTLRKPGLGWAKIATHFDGKTPNACRKRYERFNKGVKGTGPISEGGNGRGVASVAGGAPIHTMTLTLAQVRRLLQELMERFIPKSGSIQVPDLIGFTAVNIVVTPTNPSQEQESASGNESGLSGLMK